MSVRLLPKTLFGERFVALQLPDQPAQERLADGDVIGQDRSENAIELQRVIDDTLPLLQAVQPEDLSFTLGAVADALRGRGDELGANLAATGQYFGEINTVLPELQADISELADFAETYDGAADDLLAVLDNLSITNTTVVDQAEQLRRTFTVGASSANVTAGFLETNERNLISLAETSLPVLGLFAEYSPGVPLPARGAHPVRAADRGDVRDRRRPGAEPQHPDHVPAAEPLPARRSADLHEHGWARLPRTGQHRRRDRAGTVGGVLLPAPAERRHRVRGERRTRRAGVLPGRARRRRQRARARPGSRPGAPCPTSWPGSTAELDFVRNILAYQTGVRPGEVSDLAASTLAPLLRGRSVMLR